ncbi:hypothetical protein K0M31_017949, partial [Melipona bicolor]
MRELLRRCFFFQSEKPLLAEASYPCAINLPLRKRWTVKRSVSAFGIVESVPMESRAFNAENRH